MSAEGGEERLVLYAVLLREGIVAWIQHENDCCL